MRLPSSACTRCGKKVDDATSLTSDDDRPGPGDITLCINCCHIMTYADDLTVRNLTGAEIEKLKATGQWAEIEKMQFKLISVKAASGAEWN